MISFVAETACLVLLKSRSSYMCFLAKKADVEIMSLSKGCSSLALIFFVFLRLKGFHLERQAGPTGKCEKLADS